MLGKVNSYINTVTSKLFVRQLARVAGSRNDKLVWNTIRDNKVVKTLAYTKLR
jgi:hypothetical protein